LIGQRRGDVFTVVHVAWSGRWFVGQPQEGELKYVRLCSWTRSGDLFIHSTVWGKEKWAMS